MTNSARNPEPTGSPSTLSGNSSLPSPDVSSPAESGSTLTPPPFQKRLEELLTVPDPNAAAPALRLPRTVGKYRLMEEVLVGGMGVVYKAHDTELDRIVALKMIKGGLLATDEEVVRFQQEARAIAGLNHPNIVPVYENGQEEGRHFFTMAFAWGGSLAQQRGRFVSDPRRAADLVEKIARAVHYAHQRGILHRDLKPANILFDEHGIPWVSDFGLAKLVDAGRELTRDGQLLGTPSYMAPEQASGHTDQISPRTDVWALGVLLYELLTGHRPFKGGSQEEQLRKVQTTEPPRPRNINRSLHRGLETVILKCLEKEPSRRYASAETLADELARWQRGEPVMARPPSRPVRAWRALRRSRTLAQRLAFAAVLLILFALAWKGMSPSAPPAEEGNRQELDKKLAQLQRGEEVTLLDKSGPPVWWRWQPRRTDARTILDMDKVFRVYAQKQPGMLELLPASPKRYQLRAQVQHVNGQPLGRVGVYFAHGKRPTEEATTHCFILVGFNDRIPMLKPVVQGVPTQSQVQLTLPIYRETKRAVFSPLLDYSCAIARQFIPAGQVEPMPWRTLTVEVSPEWIKTFWEGKLIESTWGGKRADGCDPKKMLELACSELPELMVHPKNPPPEPFVAEAELALGEGIGLYVEQGVAAFRSVVIEPLPSR